MSATESKTAAGWILVGPGSEAPVRVLELCRELAPMAWRVSRLTFHLPHVVFVFESIEAAESHVAASGSVDLNSAWRVEWVLGGSPGKLTGNLVPGVRQIYFQMDSATPEMWSALQQAFHAHFPSDVRVPLPEAETQSFYGLRADMRAALDDCHTELTSWKTDASHALNQTEERLKALEETYNAKMALKSAVKYWTDQSKEWAKRAAVRRGWAIAIGLFAVVALAIVGWQLVVRFGTTQPPYWLLFSLLLVFGLVVWSLRLMVRAMLSDLHLAEEARLRAVMTTTYLALLGEGAAEKNDRTLVLQNIYRPVAAGLVGDEPLPTVVNELVRAIKR
jgi:hypothetical protein